MLNFLKNLGKKPSKAKASEAPRPVRDHARLLLGGIWVHPTLVKEALAGNGIGRPFLVADVATCPGDGDGWKLQSLHIERRIPTVPTMPDIVPDLDTHGTGGVEDVYNEQELVRTLEEIRAQKQKEGWIEMQPTEDGVLPIPQDKIADLTPEQLARIPACNLHDYFGTPTPYRDVLAKSGWLYVHDKVELRHITEFDSGNKDGYINPADLARVREHWPVPVKTDVEPQAAPQPEKARTISKRITEEAAEVTFANWCTGYSVRYLSPQYSSDAEALRSIKAYGAGRKMDAMYEFVNAEISDTARSEFVGTMLNGQYDFNVRREGASLTPLQNYVNWILTAKGADYTKLKSGIFTFLKGRARVDTTCRMNGVEYDLLWLIFRGTRKCRYDVLDTILEWSHGFQLARIINRTSPEEQNVMLNEILRAGLLELAKKFLLKGADPLLADKEGKFPLLIAAESGLLQFTQDALPYIKDFDYPPQLLQERLEKAAIAAENNNWPDIAAQLRAAADPEPKAASGRGRRPKADKYDV